MPLIELRTHRYFEAVARTGSVRAAAEECSLTQPAISRQIALLESALGVALFHRHRAGMTLTAAGEALHAESVRVLAQADRAERTMAHWRGAGSTIRVTCLDTTLHHIMAPFVAQTGAPIADLRPERARDIYRTLDQGVDLAVSTAAPPAGKIVHRLCEIPVSVQFRSDMRALGEAPVEIARLAGFPTVVAGHGSAVEAVVRLAAASAGVDLTVTSVVSSGQMAQAASAARGTLALTTEPPRFGLLSLPVVNAGTSVSAPLLAVWDRGHPAHQTILTVVRQLHDWIAATHPWAPDSASE